ncbi:MAG TPA: phosphoribosylamine--glycine ligase [Bryobacteraceae bacterium]|nr:phosphoribosylamine--glycine ligase [Bryobacteraceae bacterium]
MKVLIVGGGGREHALAWRLSQSPLVSGIVASPGNPGIATIGKCVPAPKDVSGYADIAEQCGAYLTIVGPEAPLVDGIVDHFYNRRLKIVGPTQAAARLEGSKIFAKQFLQRADIPTAASVQVTSYEEAVDALKRFSFPVVVKADGLAAGKGVIIAQDATEAERAIRQLGPRLVIEDFLEGEEVSFMGVSNGNMLLPFAPTQDHKRIFDGDRGPNTGGMGAYTDPRILTAKQSGYVMDKIMLPAIEHMRKEGTPFTGFLYAGLMMTADGPKVLEFNVRLGDPETQALMHSLHGDFADILNMIVNGVGVVSAGAWGSCSVCVVIAAPGYPEQPRTGNVITGIEEAERAGAVVFHAGTKQQNGNLVTNGGRVLGVTAGGSTLPEAARNTYQAVKKIQFPGMHYRRDIGAKGLRRW